MDAATKPQTRFGRILRAELERHPTIKSIRQLGRVMRPDAPESGRRKLMKWVSGPTRPQPASIVAVAAALGVDPSVFSEDEDEEEAAEMRDFLDVLKTLVDRAVDARLERA